MSIDPEDREDTLLPALTPVQALIPRAIASAGTAATFAWEEFFEGKIRNPHTRTAYLRAVRRFLSWCEDRQFELPRITPGAVGRYFNEIGGSTPSKKVHLAAIRAFFDVLVQRHVVILNPALSVRTERYSAVEGRTPEISVEQCRRLMGALQGHSLVERRDRAVIAVLIYTAARAGAVAKLRLKDFVYDGEQFTLRFAEKGGKARSIPVRHDLERYLKEYLVMASVAERPKEHSLFCTAAGRLNVLTSKGMNGADIGRMLKRRLKAAGLSMILSPHSFRSCTATDLLLQGVALEEVQYLLGHADARTTRLYDRRRKQVTRNVVERISV
jgi:site-specific recombinase XerD